MDAVFTPEPLTHLKLMEDMVYDRYLAHVTDRQAIKGIHIIHQKFVLAEAEGKKLDKEAAKRKRLRAQRGEPEVEEPREQMEQRSNAIVNRIFHNFLPYLRNHEDNNRVEFSEGRMFEDGVWTRYFHWFRKNPKNRRDLFQQLPKLRQDVAGIARKFDTKVRGIRENRAQENPGATEQVVQREEVMRAITKAVDLFCSVEFNDSDDDDVDIVRNREHRRKRAQKRSNRR
ncbi:unnamed protein product [Caenorhabditis brenneri]